MTRLLVALAANAAAVAVTLALLLLLAPEPTPAGANRMELAARLSLWPALTVLVAVGVALVARAAGQALNPIDDPESRFYRIAQRVLTNTVEQTLVFLPALWAFSALVPVHQLGWPGLLTAFFVAGRLLFAGGYLVHPYLRAPGMAVTLTVNILLVGWSLSLTASPSA